MPNADFADYMQISVLYISVYIDKNFETINVSKSSFKLVRTILDNEVTNLTLLCLLYVSACN